VGPVDAVASEIVMPVAEPILSPLATISPIQKEQLDAAKVSVEKKEPAFRGEIKLHIAEDAICEACQ
jgi:hypothetical protein